MCLYPKLINNPKYRANKKNGGVIPAVSDNRVLHVPIGCGNCIECRKQKKREWQIRLYEECEENKNGVFVTLTFSNESIRELGKEIKNLDGYERDNAIATLAVRRFLERWRKKYKKSVRHWLITELGHNGTENIHLHGIIWTDNKNEIDNIWKYGFTWVPKKDKKVGDRAVNYIIKYITKTDIKHSTYKPKILCSKGIGKGYLKKTQSKINKYNEKETKETYTTKQGYKIAMPIYYKNNIYTEEEREKLWIQKLDNNIRYVCGIEINMNEANAEEKYFKILETHRKENEKKGYGTNRVNWDKKIYERQLRNQQYWKRINDKNKRRSAGASPARQVFREQGQEAEIKPQNNIKNIW